MHNAPLSFLIYLLYFKNWKRNMKIGMWNVRSLLWSGALSMLHNKLLNLDFNIVALQETWLEIGIQKFDNFA
jgi:hypothetical protein